MDVRDLPALAGNLARQIGVPPPPVVVGDLRTPGAYASLAKRQGAWVLRVDPRAAQLPGPVADGYLAHPLVAASLGQHLRLLRRVRAAHPTWVPAASGTPTVSWAQIATAAPVSAHDHAAPSQ